VPLFWQALVLFLVFCFLEGLTVVMVTQWVRSGPILLGVFLWGLLKVLEAAGVIYVVLSLRALQNGGKELAAGNLDHQIPLEKLRGPFRDHGETLNNIRSAIQTAVEEQMTAERMKTELITNVSHDIKTPLTSIVSYVDLLKKEDLPQGKAQDYLEVLDRQSAKLKKLIEDLVEASKASTGAMEVHCQRTDVNVLLSQSAGEYGEKLAGRDLTLVMTQAEDNPAISADGRLLWRVLDNLLSNIVKYALAGTRVYVTSADTAEEVTLTFRNISQEPLNISAGELTQRFVRGDASRSTEGSGLGLSIAQSLTQLQQGTFQVDIDGDLFKVTLTFPRL
jgi:signal transduction histidine kinase